MKLLGAICGFVIGLGIGRFIMTFKFSRNIRMFSTKKRLKP